MPALWGAARKRATARGIVRCHTADRGRCPFIVEAHSRVTRQSAALAVGPWASSPIPCLHCGSEHRGYFTEVREVKHNAVKQCFP